MILIYQIILNHMRMLNNQKIYMEFLHNNRPNIINNEKLKVEIK